MPQQEWLETQKGLLLYILFIYIYIYMIGKLIWLERMCIILWIFEVPEGVINAIARNKGAQSSD